MSGTRFCFSVAVISVVLLLSTPGWAQTINASVEGQVLDTSGAAVAGAKVTASNASTGLSRSVVANDNGEYRIAPLPPGEYTVTAEHQGFRREARKLTLAIGQAAALSLTLQAGGVAEQVNIEAADTVAEPTRTEVSSVINQRQIQNLPVNGRQFIDFALLTPGVAVGDTTSGSTDVIIEPVTKLSFAGQNIHFNFVAVDGADNISTASGVQRATPSQEAVQEFRVINTNYSTEFGRAAGGIVNIITRSGSNNVHGSLYDFFRHDALDARSVLSSPGLDRLLQNQFGFTIGGPIKKDRTFYFGNYEGQRREESPFYNSVILANIDQINAAKVNRYGLAPENLNVLRDSDYDELLAKVDHRFSDHHNFYARYFFESGRYTNVSPLNDGFDLPSSFKTNDFTDHSVVGNLVSTLTPNLVNELRGQWARRFFDFPTVTTQPHLEVANTFTLGVNRGNPDFYRESRFELVDNLIWTRGKHEFGFGGNFNFVRTTESFPLFYPFEATFASVNDLLIGNPFVIFFEKFDFNATGLDPAVYQGTKYADPIRNQAKGTIDHTYNGFYAQDKWKATSNLALTLGVRYEFETFPKEALSNDMNNWDPRLGFAYGLGGKWNWVIRGGAGVFHGIIPNPLLSCQIPSCGGSGPYPGRENVEDSLNANTRLFAFASAPAVMQQALSTLIHTGLYPTADTGFLGESVIVRFARHHQAPYALQMSLGVEFEPWSGTSISASYLRVKGVHLGSFFNVNQPLPSGTLESGKADFAAFRPFASCRPCLLDRLISVPNFANPNFAVYFEADSRWNSVWDGLLVNVNKRFSKHFSYGISYTWSKGIDDGPNPSFVLIPENSRRFDLERALSSDDVRHRFVGNAIVAGPNSGHWLTRNWEFSVIFSAESPHHFTKFAGFDANGDVFGVNDRVGLDGRNTFEGDDYKSLDLRVSRTIHLTEKVRAQLIAEGFNMTNTLNVRFFNTVYGDSIFHSQGEPGTFFEGALNPSYGQPRAIFNPRQFQLAFKLTF